MIYAKAHNGYIQNTNTETKTIKIWKTSKQKAKEEQQNHSIKDFGINHLNI